MNKELPKSEYPRPDLDRSQNWLCLNGQWDFESEDGIGSITVPFAWETEASGIGRTWLENAMYLRNFTVPESWKGSRVFLCFGAVHHRATIRINGVEIGSHEGGYTSFEFDITDAISPGENVALAVDVEAPSDKRLIPHGKQRSVPRDDYDGVCFTPTSGIWQSVWIEARGRTYASDISLRGDSMIGFDFQIKVAGDRQSGASVLLEILNGSDERVETRADDHGIARGKISILDPHLWSPSNPYLYEVRVTVERNDHLIATAGLRSFEAKGEELFLNGERFYMRGVLDQGYWPETGATAPDESALLLDLELARAAGYNLVRKHLKFEEPRWLHLADRMGMLVWAEPASTSRFSAEATSRFNSQIEAMVSRDGNHPSIVIWGLYNEEWGLDWDIPGDVAKIEAARTAYEILALADSSRPIVENSGWAHVKTDLLDWHYYDEKPGSWAKNVAALANGSSHAFPVPLGPAFVVEKSLYASDEMPRNGIPMVNSEYGGGFTSLERAWHLRWQTQELRRHDRIAGYVYTELADVEHESAGIYTTGRAQKDLGGLDVANVNAETVLIMDLVPMQAGTDIPFPSVEFLLGVRVSHHGHSEISGTIHARWTSPGNPTAFPDSELDIKSTSIAVKPFEVTAVEEIRVPVPAGRVSARLHLWFVDVSGKVRAHTFLDAGPLEDSKR